MSLFKSKRFDNPRASYRAENPTNPKIGQKYQPDIQIPPTKRGSRKYPEKIPEKIPPPQKKYEFRVFFLSIFPGGVIWRGISGSIMFCMLGVIFAFRWLSYSVAGRRVCSNLKGPVLEFLENGRTWENQNPSEKVARKVDVSFRDLPWVRTASEPFLETISTPLIRYNPVKKRGCITVINSHTAPREKLGGKTTWGLSAPRHRNRNRYRFLESQATSQGISAARCNFGHFPSQNASQPQPYRYRREIATYFPERIAA